MQLLGACLFFDRRGKICGISGIAMVYDWDLWDGMWDMWDTKWDLWDGIWDVGFEIGR